MQRDVLVGPWIQVVSEPFFVILRVIPHGAQHRTRLGKGLRTYKTPELERAPNSSSHYILECLSILKLVKPWVSIQPQPWEVSQQRLWLSRLHQQYWGFPVSLQSDLWQVKTVCRWECRRRQCLCECTSGRNGCGFACLSMPFGGSVRDPHCHWASYGSEIQTQNCPVLFHNVQRNLHILRQDLDSAQVLVASSRL